MYADGRPELDDSSDSDVDYDHDNEDGVGYDSEKNKCVFELELQDAPAAGDPEPAEPYPGNQDSSSDESEMTDSDSDDGTLPPVLGAPHPPLPAPLPSGSTPAAEETPGAIVPVKRGRGRPPGSRNKPKTNPGSPQQLTRENNKKKRR